VPRNQDALDLSEALTSALDDADVFLLYPQIHREILVEGSLPLPLSGGSAVEDTIIAACRHLLSNMPRRYHELCPLPSSLAVRLIWAKVVHAEGKLRKKALEKSIQSTDTQELPSAVEMVVSAMRADAGYLAYILRQAIEAQALLEHFSAILGLVDM